MASFIVGRPRKSFVLGALAVVVSFVLSLAVVAPASAKGSHYIQIRPYGFAGIRVCFGWQPSGVADGYCHQFGGSNPWRAYFPYDSDGANVDFKVFSGTGYDDVDSMFLENTRNYCFVASGTVAKVQC